MLKRLGNDILIVVASFLKLWDVSLLCRAIGNVKGIYSRVKIVEINKFSDIGMIAIHCTHASTLYINVSIKDNDLNKLRLLPISKIIYATGITVNRQLEVFSKLSYLEADKIYDISKLPEIEVKFRVRIEVSNNITKLHGKLSTEELRNMAAKVDHILPFESLFIVDVDGNAIDMIKRMPLKKLELRNSRTTRPDISQLACLKLDCLNLRRLDIPANFTGMPLKELSCNLNWNVDADIKFPNLQKLKITNCQVDIETMVHLPITELTLQQCSVTNLISLRKMKVTRLDITPSTVITEIVDVICSLPLTSLKIDNVSLSDDDLRRFPITLKTLSIMAHEDIYGEMEDPEDPDPEVEITGEILPPNLTELEFHNIFISRDGLRNIARLPIKSLTLVNCELTDKKIRMLHDMELTYINVWKNKVTSCGLKGLMHMPLTTCKHDLIDFLRANK